MQLPNFTVGRVLVVGDLMLDRYWHGATSRISPEAPVPVVHVQNDEWRAGGAGNVAINIASLGSKVSVLGFVGNDNPAQSLKRLLQNAGVMCLFENINNHPTITKIRVISRHQQLIRLDFEANFHTIDNATLLHKYHAEITQSNVVVLSDYGKGTLNNIKQFIALATNLNKLVLVDPKGKNFTKYKQASLITPNLSEFEAVVGRCANQQQIIEKGMNLLKDLEFKALLITQGENGMTLLTNDNQVLHLPASVHEVFDVTGAGDTVISVLAASLAANKPLAEAAVLANIAAGIVVAKLGTATINAKELSQVLQEKTIYNKNIASLEEAQQNIQMAKKKGEKIVLTNGCFDILHPGHIRYLQQAKTLGDRLLVLVNSDASVKRFKGHTRPINNLQHRTEMLAAMECVDWVLSFTNDTPVEEIAKLLPDILVKGGDYSDISAIEGYKNVIDNGGAVKILPFVDGYSSSAIISSIKHNNNVDNN